MPDLPIPGVGSDLPPFGRLRGYLISVLAVLGVGFSLLIGLAVVNTRRTAIDDGRWRAEAVAMAAAGEVARLVAAPSAVLTNLARAPIDRESVKGVLARAVDRLAAQGDRIVGVAAVDRSGRVIGRGGAWPESLGALTRRPDGDPRRVVASIAATGADDGARSLLVLMAPVAGAAGRPAVGDIAAAVAGDALRAAIDRLEMGDHLRVQLQTADGSLVLTTGGADRFGPTAGDGWITAVRPVAGAAALSVTAGWPRRLALASWWRATVEIALAVIVIGLALAVLAYLLFRNLRRMELVTETLSANQQRLAQLVEGLPAGAAHIADGRVFLNRAAAAMLAPLAGGPLPRGYVALLTRLFGQRWRKADRILARLSRRGFVRPITLRLGPVAGRPARLFEVAGYHTATEMVLLLRDVTDRVAAEQALRRSNSRLAALVSALPDVILVLDRAGHQVEVICGGERLEVRAPSDRLGRPIGEAFPRAVADEIEATLVRALASGTVQALTYPLVIGDDERWFEARLTPLPDSYAPAPAVLWVARDITDQRRAAHALVEAKAAAEAASAAKGQFLATMSHELRTPLNAIIGFSDILIDEAFKIPEALVYRDYAQDIRASGIHLLELINNVLDMSRLDAGQYRLELEPVDLNDVIRSAIAMIRLRAAAGGISVAYTPDPALPPLEADCRALRQILLNLLSNAIKFTPPGGAVSFAVTRDGDRAVAVTVTDTGIGIEPDALPRIAEPFQQADQSIRRRYGGTGLGLSISRRLAVLHGGRLSIASTPGEGTRVTLSLPWTRPCTAARHVA